MEIRYLKNLKNLISEDQQKELLTKHVGVIGCGGNGGYVIEFLSRLGIKELSIWDGDKFEESNLNRQIYCDQSTLGQNKAYSAKQKIKLINDQLICNAFENYFGDDSNDLNNALKCDIIIICMDIFYNWEHSRALIRQIIEHNIPVIEEGLTEFGTITEIITAEDLKEFDELTEHQTKLIHTTQMISQPAYLCAIAAAFAVSEMVKYFNKEKNPAIGQCIRFELDLMQMHRYDFEYGQLY